jgi:4-hydroxy-tetrahydrodipicolinate reductase
MQGSPGPTISVNFLMLASKVLKKIAPYTDIEILEEHFKAKVGVSGTAKRMARYLGLSGTRIQQIRAGSIIGTHEVIFGFAFQTVRLKHESISREAFGDGAIFAAQNSYGPKRG